MKLALVSLLNSYGDPKKGWSYEYYNIEAGVEDCVRQDMFDAEYYHPDLPIELDYLREDLLNHEVDAILHVEFNDTFDLPEELSAIALAQDIPVICWSSDASWRFHNFTLLRKHRYSHFITSHSQTVPWYQANGMKVIRSQWGCSPLYKRQEWPKYYDVSFVGQRHGERDRYVKCIQASNIKLDLWGEYWEGYENYHGYAKFEEMLSVFTHSKINLNFSNPWHVGTIPQIKGRAFELPACGGFQLTTPADDITSYFVEDKEIVIGHTLDDLIDKIKYYLEHDGERQMIANAGWERCQKEHLWSYRFEHIFKEIGLI